MHYTTREVAQRPGERPQPAATRELLASLQQGAISPAAYDTAFVARLREPNDPNAMAYPQTLG